MKHLTFNLQSHIHFMVQIDKKIYYSKYFIHLGPQIFKLLPFYCLYVLARLVYHTLNIVVDSHMYSPLFELKRKVL